jgi:glycosyltransferase involved in cell wall biosynthesis
MNNAKTLFLFFLVIGFSTHCIIAADTTPEMPFLDADAPELAHLNKSSTERPIVVVVSSYNNEQWTEHTLNSIMLQEYTNFRVIIVDDCSTDNNAAIIQRYITDHHLEDRITFIHNDIRHRKLFNLYRVLYDCNDDEIVITVDGDDALAHPHVLSYINSFYDDEDIWFTYGQYKNVPASEAVQWGHKEMGYCRAVPNHIQRKHAYRYYAFLYMHPRSFRAWLFKLVKLQDLIADNIEGFEGDFYPASNDVAMYFPMIEMAHSRIKFIPDILYIRNLYSDLVGFKVDRPIQRDSAREIRKKACYTTLYQAKKNRLEQFQNASADIFLLFRYNVTEMKNIISNIQQHSQGLGSIYVFFNNTPDNKKICRTIKKDFPEIIFIPYDTEGNKNLKNRLLDALALTKNNHICLITDASYVIKQLDFSHYIFWLEKTYAYRFYLNRNSHQKGVPRYIPLYDDICAWKSHQGSDMWKGIVLGDDVFLSSKATLYQEIKNLTFNNMYTLLKELYITSLSSTHVGLFLTDEALQTTY